MEIIAKLPNIGGAPLVFPTDAFIDGKYVSAQSGATFECVFPGSGEAVGRVAACETNDVDLAVRSARKAFESGVWSEMAPQDRRKILLIAFRLLPEASLITYRVEIFDFRQR